LTADDDGRSHRPRPSGGVAALVIATVAVACCAAVPLVAAVAGGVAIGTLVGVWAGLATAVIIGAWAVARLRR
jgi:hypothetical protein